MPVHLFNCQVQDFPKIHFGELANHFLRKYPVGNSWAFYNLGLQHFVGKYDHHLLVVMPQLKHVSQDTNLSFFGFSQNLENTFKLKPRKIRPINRLLWTRNEIWRLQQNCARSSWILNGAVFGQRRLFWEGWIECQVLPQIEGWANLWGRPGPLPGCIFVELILQVGEQLKYQAELLEENSILEA